MEIQNDQKHSYLDFELFGAEPSLMTASEFARYVGSEFLSEGCHIRQTVSMICLGPICKTIGPPRAQARKPRHGFLFWQLHWSILEQLLASSMALHLVLG